MLTSDVSMKMSPKKAMGIILEAIQEVIPYELAVIMSLEPYRQLQVRYCSGILCDEKLHRRIIKIDDREDLIKALSSGKVLLVKETRNPQHLDTYAGIINLPLGHSCMITPLKAEGEIIGLMTLDHRQCNVFTRERVKFAEILSRLLAIALAQSLQNEKLISDNKVLMFERNTLLADMAKVSDSLVGSSEPWRRVLEKIRLVAPTEASVMILGETGTGKEQVAKAIHALSSRADRPFITLNCSVIQANLAESELFGHEKGAFTSAVSSRKGRFELADGGTLFLDELADLPVETQPKLLRAIQQGTFDRLGSEKTVRADVRIICATNANIETRIREGRFREDLFYRLNIFPIALPPLRQRKEDLVLLIHHFIKNLSQRFGYTNPAISEAAIQMLMQHSWPGNVRELENAVERALINSRGQMLEPLHFHFDQSIYETLKKDVSPPEQLQDYASETRKIIEKALKICNGRIYGDKGAARLLNLKPTTLQSKMKKLRIEK